MVRFALELRAWGCQLTSQTLLDDCELERQLTDERFLEANRPDMAPFQLCWTALGRHTRTADEGHRQTLLTTSADSTT